MDRTVTEDRHPLRALWLGCGSCMSLLWRVFPSLQSEHPPPQLQSGRDLATSSPRPVLSQLLPTTLRRITVGWVPHALGCLLSYGRAGGRVSPVGPLVSGSAAENGDKGFSQVSVRRQGWTGCSRDKRHNRSHCVGPKKRQSPDLDPGSWGLLGPSFGGHKPCSADFSTYRSDSDESLGTHWSVELSSRSDSHCPLEVRAAVITQGSPHKVGL